MSVLDPDRAAEAARALVGCRIDSVRVVESGRNSRVYRVDSGGRTYALKQYPARDGDPRDRLGIEAAALGLMERHGIERVPRVLAVDREGGFALLSWLDGVPIADVTETDIDAAVGFLAAIHALRRTGEFAPDMLASEACLSGSEIIRQIEARLRRLRSVAAEARALQAFLNGPFAAEFVEISSRIKRLSGAGGVGIEAVLPQRLRSLVPSDFGFHNSLRAGDGSLVFFDFEYFGWDDPVKLTADIMLHPGTALAPGLRRRVRAAAERLYGDDPSFARRLSAFYPLFGLRWVLILLNDFLPDRRRRLHAPPARREAVEREQLSKAQEFLAGVRRDGDGCTHGE